MIVHKKNLYICFIRFFICIVMMALLYPAILTFGTEQITPVYTDATTGYRVYIDDEANLLDKDEYAKLQEIMQDITAYGNVAFKTIDTNTYSSTESFSSSYYTQLFGSSSGTIFVIDMDYRNIWIHSNGAIYKTITSSYADTITDNVYTYASDGDYFSCASKVFEQELALLKGQKIRQPMKYISNALLAIILAVIINYFIVKLYSRTPKASDNEILSGVFANNSFNNYQLQFTHTTRQYSPPSSSSSGSSGGGGGGSHSSGGGGGGHSF